METKPTTISKVIAFELGLLIAVLHVDRVRRDPGDETSPSGGS